MIVRKTILLSSPFMVRSNIGMVIDDAQAGMFGRMVDYKDSHLDVELWFDQKFGPIVHRFTIPRNGLVYSLYVPDAVKAIMGTRSGRELKGDSRFLFKSRGGILQFKDQSSIEMTESGPIVSYQDKISIVEK